MARTSRAASTAAKGAASRTVAAGPPIVMTFSHIARAGGHEVIFDLEVRGGAATDMAIVSPFLQDRSLFEKDLLTPATNQMRGIRISTDRPQFLFSNANGVLLSVQVDLGSGKPRVIGTPAGLVTVR
jgi:hypothetical protein